MKIIFGALLLLTPLWSWSQQSANSSLAPIRAEAKKTFTAEMDHTAKEDCQRLEASAAVNECYEAALNKSRSNLDVFRTAIQRSIKARQSLFDSKMLGHFESSEQAWDLYSRKQGQVTADMVDNPADRASSAAATQIDLIRTHMRDLDKMYNILLHDDCGACLADQ